MADPRVEWTDAARDDLRSIVFRIAQDSLDDAFAVAGRLERRVGTLGTLTARGRVVPELRKMGERRFRELIEGPWRILYLAEGPSVSIIAIVDSRRNLNDWLREQMSRFHQAKL
ncbi:MAG: type II toxin-antitoxin system RelE/ParE family toxin [Luteimonas sp.]